MKIEGFRELYLSELQEARSIEAQLVEALPKMAEAADDAELKQAFESHLEETRKQKETVEKLLEAHGVDVSEHEDQALQALIKESEKMMKAVKSPQVRDAALIASAQRVENYEIAVYGTLTAYAQCLGLDDEQKTLHAILEEEKAADAKLSDIAESLINPEALEESAAR